VSRDEADQVDRTIGAVQDDSDHDAAAQAEAIDRGGKVLHAAIAVAEESGEHGGQA
jgi:hypothetical protein